MNSASALTRRTARAPLLACAALACALACPARAQEVIGEAKVVDGTTIEIRGMPIALWGVEGPTLDETCEDAKGKPYPCGARAARALEARLIGGTVFCAPRATREDGRLTAQCRIGGIDLAGTMVMLGWAIEQAGETGGAYAGAQQLAQRRKAGLWQGSGGAISRN